MTTPEIPPDVQEWLDDTYTAEGQRIWLIAYSHSSDEYREYLIRLARTPSGGT